MSKTDKATPAELEAREGAGQSFDHHAAEQQLREAILKTEDGRDVAEAFGVVTKPSSTSLSGGRSGGANK